MVLLLPSASSIAPCPPPKRPPPNRPPPKRPPPNRYSARRRRSESLPARRLERQRSVPAPRHSAHAAPRCPLDSQISFAHHHTMHRM